MLKMIITILSLVSSVSFAQGYQYPVTFLQLGEQSKPLFDEETNQYTTVVCGRRPPPPRSRACQIQFGGYQCSTSYQILQNGQPKSACLGNLHTAIENYKTLQGSAQCSKSPQAYPCEIRYATPGCSTSYQIVAYDEPITACFGQNPDQELKLLQKLGYCSRH